MEAAESLCECENMFQLARRHNSWFMAFAMAMNIFFGNLRAFRNLSDSYAVASTSVKSLTLLYWFEVNCPSTSDPHLIVILSSL